jgi:hypothetical protein
MFSIDQSRIHTEQSTCAVVWLKILDLAFCRADSKSLLTKAKPRLGQHCWKWRSLFYLSCVFLSGDFRDLNTHRVHGYDAVFIYLFFGRENVLWLWI